MINDFKSLVSVFPKGEKDLTKLEIKEKNELINLICQVSIKKLNLPIVFIKEFRGLVASQRLFITRNISSFSPRLQMTIQYCAEYHIRQNLKNQVFPKPKDIDGFKQQDEQIQAVQAVAHNTLDRRKNTGITIGETKELLLKGIEMGKNSEAKANKTKKAIEFTEKEFSVIKKDLDDCIIL